MAFIYDLSDTWNAGATTFTAIKMNVTDTASAAGSKLIDLQVGGTTRFDVDKNGQVEISAGTALLPSLAALGDANTGMWFPAADTIAWSTGGSERLRITSSGSVGINRTSPATKLDVNGDIGIQYGSALCFTNAGTTLTANRAISTVFSGGLDVLQLQPSGGVNGMITFHTGSPAALRSETVRINSSGGVSIGNTTDPGVGALIVNSTIRGAQLRGGYNNTTGVANTAAQALGTNTISMVLISADTTLTSTVPPAGAFASVIIKTSGATSRTVTFGTGFKSVGTLATGATADRFWVVNFVSDGTFLYESSRTTAAYA